MRILFTSDIHASSSHLFSMLSVADRQDVDSIIIGGDIIPHYLPNTRRSGILQAQSVYLKDVFIPEIEGFKQSRAVKIYLDLSNDDFICNRRLLEDRDGELFDLLHMRKHKLTDTVDIMGYMNVPPTPFDRKDWEKPDSIHQPFAPGNTVSLRGYISSAGKLEETVIDLRSEDTIENDLKRLSEMIEQPFIFISHTPPYQTALDVLYNMMHAGSLATRRFIEKWSRKEKLIVSLHGHIHESPSRSGSISIKIENSLSINPGQGSGDGANFRYVIFELLDDKIEPRIVILDPVAAKA
ncbi:metallophosphoesterase [Thermodesulfobacteriota bacterium]